MLSVPLKTNRRETDPVTFHTALSILLLVALNADDFLVTWYETLVSNWLQTNLTAETLFMPLFALVLILLHSCNRKQESSPIR